MNSPAEKALSVNAAKKLGLALSGGGFRASFFHIGVMARLAELDLLRSVEVLSCVSGGSIIGALYYLHLKRLLESKPDSDIVRDDYIRMIERIETEFLKGVQTNIRVRAFSNFAKNWRMFGRSYSRSDRMAELYDEAFYDSVAAHQRISLAEIKIQPPDVAEPFHPRKHNEKRRAKVPMLILNATTLNTGRNWQFTAVDMGERETDAETQSFEKNLILLPLRFDDEVMPHEKYRRVPVSVAVAASACVPGIFPPLALTDLYPDIVPQLVDGGVYDNQGLASIVYEQCTHVIASDGSGQLEDVDNPPAGAVSVTQRTNGVLMEKVRNQGLYSLFLRRQAGTVEDSPILHLREEVSLVELKPGEKKPEGGAGGGVTTFGISQRVQRYLSEVRTDLDSFTDTESWSLMYSGYKICGKMIGKKMLELSGGRLPNDIAQTQWKFLAIGPLAETGTSTDYLERLKVSSKTILKVYSLSPLLIPLGVLVVLVSIIVPLIPVVVAWRFIADAFGLSFLWLAGIMIVLTLPAFLRLGFIKSAWIDNLLNINLIGSAFFGALLAFLHLKIIDPLYVKKGKLSSFQKS